MAKPMPGAAAPPSSGSVAASVGIPITRPSRSASAPPEFPGLIAALVWIISGSATPFPSETPCRKALTIPSVTLERRPSGFPIAIAKSPTWRALESANAAGVRCRPDTRTTARSSGGKRPTSDAPYECAPAVTVNGPLAPTTWLFVTMSPFESKTTPEPSPCGLWIWTTDGDSLCTTAVTACWKASAAAAGLRREWLVFGAVFGEEPPPSDTAATMPPATAAPATGASHQMCRRSMRSLYRRRRADSRIPSYDQAAMIYCVIPRELADELYDKMVEYYQDNPNVTVIIDRREGRDRRNEGEQRLEDKERRTVRERRRAHPGTFPDTDAPE